VNIPIPLREKVHTAAAVKDSRRTSFRNFHGPINGYPQRRSIAHNHVLFSVIHERNYEARVFVVHDVKVDGNDVLLNPIDSLLVFWLV
jgi:hypothetical protein